MKVAVLGSMRGSAGTDEEKEKFFEACQAVGRELANRGDTLLVTTDNPETADPHVVDGANRSSAESVEVIVYRPLTQDPARTDKPFADGEHYPKIRLMSRAVSGSWINSHAASLKEADAILVIGGGTGAEIAAYNALVLGKPVLPIPTFGGTARKLWQELVPEFNQIQLPAEQAIFFSWTDRSPSAVADALAMLVKRRAHPSSVPRDPLTKAAIYAAVLFVVALAPIPFTWYPTGLGRTELLSLLLLVPLLAGAAGAIARPAVSRFVGSTRDSVPLLRLAALGLLAGGISGLLFVSAQLVAVSPTVDEPTWLLQAGRLMPFVLVVGVIAGLTLEAVFQRLVKTEISSPEMMGRLSGGLTRNNVHPVRAVPAEDGRHEPG
jgi:predicted Rossmann-fold nucleotide-binding protein